MAEAKKLFDEFILKAETDVLSAPFDLGRTAAKEPLLNGVPYRLFRQSVGIDDRRLTGAFFSGPKIASRLADMINRKVDSDALVMDPTCGIGDLLLAYANKLPVEPTIKKTLCAWGKKLAGIDLQPDLVKLTKLRLVMLARFKGQFTQKLENVERYLPKIVTGNMLEREAELAAADAFLFNPPFGQTSELETGYWSSGLVNSAAVFLNVLIKAKQPSAPIAAILPEVLRCGSRYEKFRRQLENQGIGGDFDSLGRFDNWADVDVFTTFLAHSEDPKAWRRSSSAKAEAVIGDFFNVRVGPVVPHRHPNKGAWHRYVYARTTPAWTSAFEPETSRRFTGTLFHPPIVVVRRTSSPNDRARAIGAVIVGDRLVAVENHLLVLEPKEPSLAACQRLMRVLKRQETSDFLNETIRCRHLTTGSVASIPWWDADG